jgi:ubiquinone/menaquinone biosynthesis C-methylase UbiE
MKRLRTTGAVIANDLSLPMLRTAQSLSKKEHLDERILFVRSDSEEMPFGNGTLDGAVCGGSLNEFQQPQRMLAELHRALKLGAHAGLMMQVAAPAPLGSMQKLLGGFSGLAFPTAQEALNWMRRHFVATVTHEEGAVLMVKLAPQ